MALIGTIGRLNNGVGINTQTVKVIRSVNRIGSTPLNIDSAEPLTISTWFRPTFFGAQDNVIGVISNGTEAGNATGRGYYLFLLVTGTAFRVGFGVDTRTNPGGKETYISTTTTFPFGNTYHFAAIKTSALDGSNWEIWVNGVLQPVSRPTTAIVGSIKQDTYLKIGAIYDSYLFSGSGAYGAVGTVYKLKMITRAITAAEVTREFVRESEQWVPDTQLFLPFLESKGKTISDFLNTYPFTLVNFTDAETASNGQPQSGNTAWVNAYSQLPITR